MANEPENMVENKAGNTEGAPVQKKRASVVFRPQNSSQKGRPLGNANAPKGRPVGRPVARQEEAAKAVKPAAPKAPETKVPETKAPETKGLETKAPVKAPEAKAPEVKAPEAKAPEVKPAAPKTSETEEKAAPVKAPEAKAPEAKAPVRGERPQTARPQSDRPQNSRPQGDRPQGTRPQGDRPYNSNRPQGDRPYNNNRPQSDRPQSNRPAGDRPYNNNRPQGDRPYNSNRPQGDRPYNSNRPQGDRPYNSNRPAGDRPYNSNRPQGDRPYNGNRPQGDRPAFTRPAGAGARPGFNGAGFDKDKDADRSNQNRPASRRPAAGAKPAAPLELKKPSSKKMDNRQKGKYDKRDKEKEDIIKSEKLAKRLGKQQPVKQESAEDQIKTVTLPDVLTIKELAESMKLQPSAIVKKLFLQGKVVTINQEIDYDTAESIALEFDYLCEKEVKVDVIEELLKDVEDDPSTLVSRPPVVCVMGHVDHGKTSLLDAIRATNVTARESGGITQHIGAYIVEINGQKITFLDTPGHEAFTAMRMRGAQSTDIAILVVAADDGVMPQTIEAISHAKAAGVEIIVAINKIDKPSANIERVKQELTEYELIPEDWGGSTIFAPVSAHTKEGIENLLEMILLVAEVKELKANPNREARGLVIEAELDKGKGPVATVLVQKGTLHVGDSVAAGSCFGKVRAMLDDKGRRVKVAGPSTPVEILGLNDVPNAGEIFVSTKTEKEARNFAETFIKEGREKLLEDTKSKLSLDDLFSQIQSGNVKELNIIIKADVQGSVEAVKQSLMKLSNDEVVVKVIHGGVGAVNESDVTLAATSNAIIIGFNVRPDVTARSIAEREKVDLRLYKVIYQAIADVEAAMKGMLDPVFEEKIIGHAIVRQTFKASGVGTIAGSYVTDGKFVRGCSCRITRAGEQIFDGALASLKRFKDDVKEVATGYECGLVFEKFNDLAEDDMIEAYTMVEVPR